jgi:hypothetical protein
METFVGKLPQASRSSAQFVTLRSNSDVRNCLLEMADHAVAEIKSEYETAAL